MVPFSPFFQARAYGFFSRRMVCYNEGEARVVTYHPEGKNPYASAWKKGGMVFSCMFGDILHFEVRHRYSSLDSSIG